MNQKDYEYAIPFYGLPRPILIDLAIEDNKGEQFYDSIERESNTVRAEASVPCIYKGKGAFLWGTASPLFDPEGNTIGAIETIRDITQRKTLESSLRKREKELEENACELQETNTALRVLLRQRENDQRELEESILSNIKGRVLPYLENLKKSRLDEWQKINLEILENHLNEIISPSFRQLSAKHHNLTPMEIRVADLIKAGKTSKEIAQVLGVAEKTVLSHRYNLRTKLKLKNEKVNLRSHLISFS